MIELLQMAAKIALPTTEFDKRRFWLGCVGIRKDGTLVSAKNGATMFSTVVEHYHLLPNSHAEGRVLRKMDKGGTLFVSRIAKGSRKLAMACPCSLCTIRIKSFGVKKVFYTINEFQYGLWDVKKDYHEAFNF